MTGRRMRLVLSAFAIAFVAISNPAFAGKSKMYTRFLSGVAVGGYDAVAYFSEKRPATGADRYDMTYKAATWRFANCENLERFRTDPTA